MSFTILEKNKKALETPNLRLSFLIQSYFPYTLSLKSHLKLYNLDI